MNPETLNGTVLGTYTLQQMVGRGGLGVVFRAQQERSSQSVALKVLLPSAALSPEQRTLFLQRFRRDMAVVSTLAHAHILPVLEYGDSDGMAYLVMPYRSDGTLQDVLAKAGQLSWPDLMYYLDQMAAAIDYAQERGVAHRNLQPANVLLATDGALVVTDFALVTIMTEGLVAQELLLGASGPCVAPNYIAPEQVMGESIDGRADLYSLAVILYQMVTGKTPFQGTTAVYIAAQHVQLPPPSPRALRPDVPRAAEQVMLRALAKQPSDRYTCAQDFADAFRAALATAGIALPATQPVVPAVPANTEAAAVEDVNQPSTGAMPLWSKRLRSEQKTGGLRTGNDLLMTPGTPTRGLYASARPLEVTGKLSSTSEMMTTLTAGKQTMPEQVSLQATQATSGMATITNTTRALSEIQQLTTSTTDAQPAIAATPGPLSPFPPAGTTDALRLTGEQRNTATTIKLTDAMKIVQLPVAGQPGKYMTGFLPVLPSAASAPAEKSTVHFMLPGNFLTTLKRDPKKRIKFAGIVALIAIIILSSSVALFIHARTRPPVQVNANRIIVTPNALATASAKATATEQANIILTDPLS